MCKDIRYFVSIVWEMEYNMDIKVIHKEYSIFLNQFFLTPCLYHAINIIIHTSYIRI